MKFKTDIDTLSRVATGRSEGRFLKDVHSVTNILHERLAGCRVLAIGAAGSIGAATVRELASYRPAALHVVDQNENTLVELVRDLRSGVIPLEVADFRTLPLDCGAPVMGNFMRAAGPYDCVLNFAALKHVRSEKDVYSLAQLLDTNLLKQARLLQLMAELGYRGRYFCVSTDKAANPVNLMGASKRLMEHLIFCRALNPGLRMEVTSARFANVAFSSGSLLAGFLLRMEKRQPLAVPRNTRRYFVSLREAGQICLLAAIAGPADHIVVPRLDAGTDLKDLESVAAGVLHACGLRARFYDDEHEAKARVPTDLAEDAYPVLRTPLDTSGEKAYEEFVGEGESEAEIGFAHLAAVPYVPAEVERLRTFLQRLESLVDGSCHPSKPEVISWIAEVVPTFLHVETSKHLDQRM